jgi:hypothetical protein
MISSKTTAHSEPWFFLAVHIIVPIFLTGIKNDVFSIFLFITISFFYYNIAEAFFATLLKGTEYGRSEKSTEWKRVLIL